MWKAAAQRYKDNTAVIGYDLMVEPNANVVLYNEYDPVAFYAAHGGSLSDWNQLHPRISAGIRTIDTATPILTSGMSYGSINWLSYVTVTADGKTVYTVHDYEPFVYTHQDPPNLTLTYPGTFDADGDGIPDTVNVDWIRSHFSRIDTFKAAHPGKPVAVNEFGVKRWEPGAAAYFADVATVLEEKKANRALWIWSDSWPNDQYADDFNFRHGSDPANHVDVATSPLIQSIKADLALNTPICPTITVSPSSLAQGTVGVAYAQSVTASGGASPYAWGETGALPNGVTFANGSFSGTPTQSGSYPITVTATDANGCTGSRGYTLVVASAGCSVITLSPTSLPGGTVGTAYAANVTASGGTPPYAFALTSGTLPAGLTFSNGAFSATPTQSGSFPITVTVTDYDGCTGSRAYALVIQPAGGGCTTGGTNLCIQSSRFSIHVNWTNRYVQPPLSGVGTAVGLTSDTGYFWFFNTSNVELIIKVLDGRAVNGKFWVFYGALKDVEYTIFVTDTQTGGTHNYFSANGSLKSVADVNAF